MLKITASSSLEAKTNPTLNSTKSLAIRGLIIALLAGFLVQSIGTVFMVLATLSYFLMLTGLLLRKKDSKVHARFMLSAIAIDLVIVLILQLTRDAVGTAVELSLSPLQQAHVYASSIATVFYFPVIYFGSKLYRQKSKSQKTDPKIKKKHQWVGLTAFVFRTLGFILMFSLIGRHY